jgi:hypothetical protein
MPTAVPLTRARELSLGGLLGALGLLLPVGFHALGWAGKVFLPMHVPVVVAAFVVGPSTAAAVGFVVPLLSSVLTGMPPLAPPVAPLMAVELAAKAVIISVAYRALRWPFWVALPLGIVADWVVLAAAALAAADLFSITAPPAAYVGGVIAVSLPGTVLQLVAAPLAVAGIERRLPRVVPTRKPRRAKPMSMYEDNLPRPH